MRKPLEARLAYYLRKGNELFDARHTMDRERKMRRFERLMRYKAEMNRRMSAALKKDSI